MKMWGGAQRRDTSRFSNLECPRRRIRTAHCFHLIRDRVGPKIGLHVRSKRTPFNKSNEDCSISDHRLLLTNAFLWSSLEVQENS
jgi:hypothetical protein